MSTEIDERNKELDDIWQEIADSCNKHNEVVDRNNKRRFALIEKIHGKAFVRNLIDVFKECECLTGTFGFRDEFVFIKSENIYKKYFAKESFGSKIKGYYVEQWSEGDSGDSFSGFIYVEIKKNRFIKAPFSC